VAGHLSPPVDRDLRSDVVFSIITWFTASGIIAAVINSTMGALRHQTRTLQGNISDLQQAEEALRERTAILNALLNAPLETVALLDPDGQLLSINESGARRLGATPEELIGRNVFSLLPPDVAESRNALIAQVFHNGEPIHFEDSREGIHFANSVYPVFDQDGERVTSVAVFASDITERIQAEEALAQRVAELERFNRLTVGREMRMIELKRQVNELSVQVGQPPPYDVSFVAE
jgi:PAS domain S-box-containing protein